MPDEKYLDVLQNIEFAIVEVYNADREKLIDKDAKEALDALLRYYRAVEEGRQPPDLSLSAPGARVFDAVRVMCEFRLGRAPLPRTGEMIEAIPVSELVACLRKVQKSITRWSSHGGRQGYLKFVSQYVS
jgi:hypothetical protein